METVKNYFKYLADTILKGLIFFKNNLKTQAIIWLLIIAQVISYLMIVIPMKLYGAINTLTIALIVALGVIIYVPCLFFMFKKVFNLISNYLEKDKLSNKSILIGLLVLGLFNIVPVIFFLFIISLAKFNNSTIFYMQIIANIFTVLYYLSLFLSLASLVYFQKENPFYSVFQSMKYTFKNILTTAPLYLFIYAIGQIAVILICTFCFYIIAKFIPLTQYLLESFHAIVNNLALYLTAPLYIAVQSILIKDLAKGKDDEQNQQIS